MYDTPSLFLKNYIGRESARLSGFFKLLWLLGETEFWWGAACCSRRWGPLLAKSLHLAGRSQEWACSASSLLCLWGFLSQSQEQGPALMLNGLLSSLFWLVISRKAGRLRKVSWVFPFINVEWYWLLQALALPASLVTSRVQRFALVWITRYLNYFVSVKSRSFSSAVVSHLSLLQAMTCHLLHDINILQNSSIEKPGKSEE